MDKDYFDAIAYVLDDDQCARLCGLLAVIGHFIKDIADTPIPRKSADNIYSLLSQEIDTIRALPTAQVKFITPEEKKEVAKIA